MTCTTNGLHYNESISGPAKIPSMRYEPQKTKSICLMKYSNLHGEAPAEYEILKTMIVEYNHRNIYVGKDL